LTDKNACGFTPLLSAANGGQLEMSEWLLNHGATLEEADYDGYTSLILAACGGNIELVKFFIAKGSWIKERNSNGDTALLLASYCGHRELVDWLLKSGAYALNLPFLFLRRSHLPSATRVPLRLETNFLHPIRTHRLHTRREK
jgi:ankyrin repeat protein